MKKTKSNTRIPPSKSSGVFSDIRMYLFHKPEVKTLIKFKSLEERQDYSERIIQRLGVSVSRYAILNIHQIGIDVPLKYAFEELLNWNGDSTCWPNYIARVSRIDNDIERIKIYLFGRASHHFGLPPLFNLDAIRIQRIPEPYDFDNARYLLYRCSGGYPIGIFSMYVRSPISERNEVCQTQLFFTVGFNFYGKENLTERNIVNRIWERVHDRVTSNTMIRFKQLCEWRFGKMQQGEKDVRGYQACNIHPQP